MTELLRRWLDNNGLEVKGSFEKEFASGYKLAQVLHHFNLQPDFSRFHKTGDPDSLLNNYVRLQPTLTNLGVKMNTNIANDLMTEKVGAAAKVLYAVKSHVEGLSNDLEATRTTKLGSTLTAQTLPHATLVESQRFRSEKFHKNSGDLKTFEENLRIKANPPNKLREAMHLKKFEDEMIRQTFSARDGEIAEAMAWEDARDTFRSTRLGQMGDDRTRKADNNMSDYEAHKGFLDRQNATELEELRVEMTIHQKRSAHQQVKRAEATAEVIDGIEAYENNLRRIGSTGEGDATDDNKLPPIGPTPFDHIQRVRTMAPPKETYAPGADRYLGSLHTKKRDETAARKEREARRRRVMVEQQKAQEKLQAKAQLDLLVSTLQQESAEETRLASRMWQLNQERETVRENRLLREEQYKERREADWRARLTREAEMIRSLKEQFSEEAAGEIQIWREAEEAKAKAKREKHEAMCKDIAWAISGIAFRAAEYRETTAIKVPRKEFREWVAMFVAGDEALLEPLMKDDRLFHVAESKSALDEGVLDDYIRCVGEWETAVEEEGSTKTVKLFNEPLGDMVMHLSDLNAVAEEEGAAAALESLEVEEEEEEEEEGGAPSPAAAAAEKAKGGAKAPEKAKGGAKEAEAEAAAEAEAKAKEEADAAAAAAAAEAEAEALEAAAAAEAAAVQVIPNYPFKMAVVGAPFSGKTTVARDLAEKMKIKVLSPVSVMDSVVKAAQKVDDDREAVLAEWTKACEEAEKINSDAPPRPDPVDASTLSEDVLLGRRVREVMQAGEEPTDELMLELILFGINSLPPPGAVPVAEPPLPEGEAPKKEKEAKKDAKGGDKKKKGDKGVVEETECMGFILDGFPSTKQQSVLLEKALTGLDLSKEEARMNNASRVAPPPPEKIEANLNRALLSGLDHVLVLSVSDEETVLKRAVGRRVDPETGKIYHLEFDPPPTDKLGLAEKLTPVEDESYDGSQVQSRLRVYISTAPALDQWLSRFVKLRYGLDATTKNADEICAEAAAKASELLSSKSAHSAAVAAAASAADAMQAARDARGEVFAAKAAAQQAARDLLAAKKAELMAALDLATDPAAAELVKGEASASCAKQVLAGNEALKAAEAAAQQAEEAAKRAQEALDAALQTLGNASLSAQAEIDTKAASEEATLASEQATAAATRAKESAAATAQVVQDALSRTEQAEKIAEAEAAEAAAAATAAKAKSKAPAKGGAEAEPSEMEQLLTLPEEEPDVADDSPPEPEPKPTLSGAMAAVLHQQWQQLEDNYLSSLQLLFGAMREERTEIVNHFVAVQKGFVDWLKRPDNRPILLAEFQEAFDAIDGDVRKRQAVVAELLLRADELRDALWDVCDSRLAENEDEHKAILKDSFVADHSAVLAAQVQSLLQVELDRFYATVGLAQSYACAEYGINMPTDARRAVRSQDLGVDTVPPRLEGFFNSKAPYNWPEWVSEIEAKPKLVRALQYAWGLAIQETRADPLPGLPGAAAPEPEEGADGGAAAAKAKGKGKTAAEEEAEAAAASKFNLEHVAAARELAKGMVSREVEILRSRIKMLAGRVKSYEGDLSSVAENAHGQCEKWLHEWYHAECSSAQAVHNRIIVSVEAGTPLEHDLRLEGPDLVVDESTFSAALPALPAVTARAPAENSGSPSSVLSTQQLSGVASAFLEVSASGYILLSEAAAVLQRVGASESGSGLPQGWRDVTFTQVATALRLFDPHTTGYIAWHDLLGALVIAAFPSVLSAGPEVLGAASASLMAIADPNGRIMRHELLGSSLWFDTDGMNMAEREAEAAKEEPYVRGSTLKSLLFDALSTEGAEGSERKVKVTTLLLYLSMDFDHLRGLQKAFAVVSVSGSSSASLRGKRVAEIAYPRGTDGCEAIGRLPSLPEEVAKTVKGIAQARGGQDADEVTAEQLMYSLAGNKLMTELLYWLQLKDPYSALRL